MGFCCGLTVSGQASNLQGFMLCSHFFLAVNIVPNILDVILLLDCCHIRFEGSLPVGAWAANRFWLVSYDNN